MERDLAKLVVITATRASTNLNQLLIPVRENCSTTTYNSFLKAVGSVNGIIYSEIIQKAYDAHPDIEAEITASIEKYGIAF